MTRSYKKNARCRAGLHAMTEDNVRYENVWHGGEIIYKARRCRKCQKIRWQKWFERKKQCRSSTRSSGAPAS